MPGQLELPFGIKLTNPQPLSAIEGPYADLASACAAVPLALRYPTMQVRVVPESGDPYIAQWLTDLNDGGLTPIPAGSAPFDMTAYIASAPVYADEYGAATADIPENTMYKTPTGELRYRLNSLIYTFPFTLA